MKKQNLNDFDKRFRLISPRYFLAVAVVFLIIAVYGLRQNNFTMIKLRQAVITADKNNGDVETALDNLRTYVYSHMNTNLSGGPNSIKPPIQLQHKYNQLVAKKQSKINAENKKVQDEASGICAKKFPASGYNSPRVTCIQDYVSTHAKTATDEIPPALYQFDFVSPVWSPDLAGFSILISFMFFVLFACRLAIEKWFRSRL